ncbi:MAG: hypothetical protein ABIT04_02225 [Novosphingobium sp.]
MLRICLIGIAATLATVPAFATEPNAPITRREPSAADVATTPMNDLNLRKEQIAPVLTEAQEHPYDLAGLGRCAALAAEVGRLDAALGDDIDLQQSETHKISAGRVAQTVVGSFIPFRGLIREVSGANQQQRLVEAAVEAGIARRSFLKGVGQAKGCPYPARSANADAIARYGREREARAAAKVHPESETSATPK